MHEVALGARVLRGLDRAPPVLERHRHDAAAEALDRVQLRLRRVVGHDDGAGQPRSRAPQATPCAMLPALAVTTPRSSAPGGASAIAFIAPRILNEPIGCRHSSLR